MDSLEQFPEILGFFSYSRHDNEASRGSLSNLHDAIQRDLSGKLGRTERNFRVWRDQEAIAPGKVWEAEINQAIGRSVFFIPIVTPLAVRSPQCQSELSSFVERESKLGRDDLIFPIHYITVPELLDEAQWRNHPFLSIVRKRQYVDLREFQYEDVVTSTAYRKKIGGFCEKIAETLRQRRILSENLRQPEAEATRSAGRLRQEAQASQRARVQSARPSPPDATIAQNLGLLADLRGLWKGTGFNLVARPARENNANLYLQLNQTLESLKVNPIGSPTPNRGFEMDDIELFGLTYLQETSDVVTGGTLHIEPGLWMRQPAKIAPEESPPAGDDIVFRAGSIPQGNTILVKGTARKFNGPPTLPTASAPYNGSLFPSFNSTPFPVNGPIFAPGTAGCDLPARPTAPSRGFTQYALNNPPSAANPRTPFGNVPEIPLPTEINGVLMQDVVTDPIILLQEVVAQQQVDGYTFQGVALNIASRTSITFGTERNQTTPTVRVMVPCGGGRIENIPFLVSNAELVLMYATFWITTVSHSELGESFLQLQYAQMVLLNFPVLHAQDPKPVFSWPHVTVGTLTRVR